MKQSDRTKMYPESYIWHPESPWLILIHPILLDLQFLGPLEFLGQCFGMGKCTIQSLPQFGVCACEPNHSLFSFLVFQCILDMYPALISLSLLTRTCSPKIQRFVLTSSAASIWEPKEGPYNFTEVRLPQSRVSGLIVSHNQHHLFLDPSEGLEHLCPCTS